MNPSRTLLVLLSLALLATLPGCQSLPQPQSEVSPQARFAEYRTFAVLPPRGRNDQVDPRDLVRLAGPMRAHLEAQIQARGLLPAPPDKADVVFELIGSVSTELSLHPWPDRMNYRWGWAPRYPLYGYYGRGGTIDVEKRGILSVVAYDRAASAVVWASWMEGTYYRGEKVETVTAALDALLATLPAR
jgi:hypothetical protein